jgi:lipoprotein-anchoring transpeptidase ErfK/SrfK
LSGSPPPTSSQAHTVKPGETLFAIATRYGVTVWALTQANDIGNPSTLYAGQVLTIPSGGTPPPRSDDIPPSAGATKTYSVQRGDTLFRIAAHANIPISALLAANAITTPDHIYVGQVLTLPPGAGDIPATNAAASPTDAPTITDGKQIVIDLSEQRVYAFENGQAVRQFVVSTGLPATPTVTGEYAIYVKYDSQAMSGPGYSLPNVPWVMYFYRGYGLHGTYWHNNFGQPMSHGCVNMRTAEAAWLYNWAPLGTSVRVVW